MSYVWAGCRLVLRDGGVPSEAMIDRRIQMLRLAGLCDKECERLRHIRNREARLQSVGARVALLWALLGEAGVFDWEQTPDVIRLVNRPLSSLGRDVHGAPQLAQNRSISLAHCRGMAVAVLADAGSIGVDIEPVDRPLQHPSGMAERFFSPAERQSWVDGGEDTQQFLRIWTCKEALGKAKGLGLDRIRKLDTTAASLCFEDILLEGYILTVCQLE